MGELALRRIQVGVEGVPGTAVLATRKVYGTFEPKRNQARRWAMEERGVLAANFRGNAKLVDASWVLKSDVLFEDFPYFLEIMNKGGVAPVGSAATGYTYDYTPTLTPADLVANPLKTVTFEWGDEDLQWQFPYSQGDAMKVEMGTDDPIMFEMNGFAQESWPRGRNNFLKHGTDRELLTAFTDGIGEHAVEAPNGWQIRMFMDKFDPFDVSHDPIGTTYIPARYIKATAEYKNENKRKYFGDFAPFYQKIGRGKRAVVLNISLEEEASSVYDSALHELGDMVDTNQPNFRVPQTRIRLQAVGSQIDTSSFGTINGAMTQSGGPYTHLTTNALTEDIPGGAALVLGDHGQIVTVTPAGASSGDLTVPIVTFTPRNDVADSANIYRAKSIEFDFYGALEGDVKWAAHETNVAYDLSLVGVFDIDAAKQDAIFVTNDLASVTAIDLPAEAGTPPDAPTAVTAVDIDAVSMTVSWTPPTPPTLPIDGYQMRSTETTSPHPTMLRSADADDVSAIFYGLTTMTEYTFAVRAHNAAGFSAWSAESAPETTA